jgi:pimeloyl-ACP methyl ester carboxylesterase
MLRGLTREAGHWGEFRQQFGERFSDDQVICIDLPGAGDNRSLRASAKLADYTDFIRSELARLNPDQLPVIGLGLSMGGMILLDWAARFPGELRGVVAMNTSAANLGWPWQRLNWRALHCMARMLANRGPEVVERAILDLVSNHGERRLNAVRLWVEIRRLRPTSIGNMLRQLLAAARFRVRFVDVRIPILLLASRGDRLVSVHISRLLAEKLSTARLVLHDTAGHDLPIDDPQWITEQVAAWATELPAVQNGFAASGHR